MNLTTTLIVNEDAWNAFLGGVKLLGKKVHAAPPDRYPCIVAAAIHRQAFWINVAFIYQEDFPATAHNPLPSQE